MKNSKTLVSQSVQEIEASSKTSQTEAGRSNNSKNQLALQDTINQVFALFRINFHNQYHAAFSDTQLLNQAKKLWLESLDHFSPDQILLGAKHIIEHSEYLPTLHRMISSCENHGAANGLPSARDAYLEACNASSPKANFDWTHPAIYHAGKKTGWHLLANEPETVSYPEFRKHYQNFCRKIANGDIIAAPEKSLPDKAPKPMSQAEKIKHLRQLRKELEL